ncbi:BppU family phage baseplate upper protein [Mammaliicoccus sciuri]|uniref:BppU family phage baseplate upper protein n=1 Tax=Mammaliicoccus sciuri TaxID=1296 RepID=UPI00194E940B|nr:BppU family phage baseplate upper protein [Mammaliicoccus sciuri]
MSMNKIADVQLETTAEYQDLSKLNVKFWNQDKNTATLKFNITRNNYPLSLSEENVKVFIALESGDSFLVDDDLDYLDELNGVVSYTIPNDFMRVATNVLGQVYVTTLDEEEVIVQRQFSFNVANDLIAELPAEEKIKEFKYFSDMREEVAKMLTKLNSDFENMNDYVSQVDQKTKDGIDELNSLISQKEQVYNDNHTAKMKEITDKGNQYTNDFTSQREYINTKYTDFQNAVQGSGLVTTSQSANWQKHKLTNDDGRVKQINGLDFNNPEEFLGDKSQFIYVAGTSNYIGNYNGTVNYLVVTSGYKRIEYRPNGMNKVFYKNKENGVWLDWYDPTKDVETITGSQAKANTAESNAKTYAKDLVDKKTTILFEGTANGVGTTINLSETLDNFIVLHFYGTFPGGLFNDVGNPFGTSRISLTPINLLDATGNGGGIYEVGIDKTTRTQLTISNDVFFDLGKLEGSGPNANRCTITRIVGVRK